MTDKKAFNTEVDEMLSINEAQKQYYEVADGSDESEVNSLATNLWRRWRGRALSVFDEEYIEESLAQIHLDWIGDNLSDMKVLDLGVGYGNPLSMRLAEGSREYVAIDLSSSLVEKFQQWLDKRGVQNARACVADILSDEFEERDFDLVYASAVFHHFRHFDAFLENLSGRMSPGGKVVTLNDPIETWLPIKLLRLMYRPFQTDADWEFPFNRKSLRSIERVFNIEQVQGTYDASKWAIPLGFVMPDYARNKAKAWHQQDLDHPYDQQNVTSSLRVSMLLGKK